MDLNYASGITTTLHNGTAPKGPNRRSRRAAAARKRCLIQKHTPFGRVRVIDIESGDMPQDDRIVYRHFTKGLMDRRTSIALLDNLMGMAA